MPEENNRQAIVDYEHLKLLALGYKISAATTAFYSLFGLLYVFMGVIFGTVIPRTESAADKPPAFIGWFFAVFGMAVFFGLVAMAALKLRAAICIQERRSRTFCTVIAAIGCVSVPYGTILGIFSFVVLGRPSVMRQFEPQKPQTV